MRAAEVNRLLGSVTVKREDTTPQDVVDETSKREVAHGRNLNKADAKLSRCYTSRALINHVTQTLSETLSILMFLLKVHEISCPGTTADGTDGPPSWTHAALHWPRRAFHAPPAKKHLTERHKISTTVSASLLHRAQKTPFTAGIRYYSGFDGVARNLGGCCATMLAVKALSTRTASIQSCVLINDKCISLPCSRIVVPTPLLRRHLVQDLFTAYLG